MSRAKENDRPFPFFSGSACLFGTSWHSLPAPVRHARACQHLAGSTLPFGTVGRSRLIRKRFPWEAHRSKTQKKLELYDILQRLKYDQMYRNSPIHCENAGFDKINCNDHSAMQCPLAYYNPLHLGRPKLC